MFKQFLFLAFLAAAATAVPVETQFACQTESANKLGASPEKSDEVADSLMLLGVCKCFDKNTYAYVVHRGPTSGSDVKVTVVGKNPEMWGVIPTAQLRGDRTI